MSSVHQMMKMMGLSKPTKSSVASKKRQANNALKELKDLQSSLNLGKKSKASWKLSDPSND